MEFLPLLIFNPASCLSDLCSVSTLTPMRPGPPCTVEDAHTPAPDTIPVWPSIITLRMVSSPTLFSFQWFYDVESKVFHDRGQGNICPLLCYTLLIHRDLFVANCINKGHWYRLLVKDGAWISIIIS